MNLSVIMGRITAPLELKVTTSGKSVISFTVAVDRGVTNSDGGRITDFIPCVAWGKTAEFVKKYFDKGSLILIKGSMYSRKYESEGKNRTVIELNVEKANFTGEKRETATEGNSTSDIPGTMPIPNDEDLPF